MGNYKVKDFLYEPKRKHLVLHGLQIGRIKTSWGSKPEYPTDEQLEILKDEEIFVDDDENFGENVDLFGNAYDEDPLYEQALDIVIQAGKASASYIQRKLKIGYNRAARLIEEMEERGIVGPANGSKPREIIHMPN